MNTAVLFYNLPALPVHPGEPKPELVVSMLAFFYGPIEVTLPLHCRFEGDYSSLGLAL